MKTQIVYVLIASDETLFLEEFWASLYSLRHFHQNAKVITLVDQPTADLIKQREELYAMISKLIVVDVPNNYSSRLRSRYIKTSVRNLIDGDYFCIDTDTVITKPLDEIDQLPINNIGMVPELHGPFKEHTSYRFICNDVKRIFDADISDSPYWFNSGASLVKDNQLTRDFFKKWNENWKHSALEKGQSSDQRALIYTDKSFGYIIEKIPDVYNCQMSMSLRYFYDAKILHFWHMRGEDFHHSGDYSPFCDKTIYQKIHRTQKITEDIAETIIKCKSSISTYSMIVGKGEINFLFSSFYTVLGRAYNESKSMHWILDKLTKYVNLYYRAKKKLGLKGIWTA